MKPASAQRKVGAARRKPSLSAQAAARAAKMADTHRATRRRNAAELAEDYVELINELLAEKGEARSVDIAQRLGVSHVTVTKTVQRLQREGLVRAEPYRSIFLTPAGSTLAKECRQRHQGVVEFLLALGVAPETAEIDAEGLEHHVSEQTLRAMRKFVAGRRAVAQTEA